LGVESKYMIRYAKYLAYFTLILAIATIILAISTCFLWYYAAEQSKDIKKSIAVASDTAIRQLRAYVNFVGMKITNVDSPLPSDIRKNYRPSGAEIFFTDKGPMVNVEMRNSGQTPAYNVKMWMSVTVREYPLKSSLEPPRTNKPYESVATFASQAIYSLPTIIMKPLTQQQINSIRDGSAAIYIYGEITYDDIFGLERKTRMQGIHNGVVVRPIGVTTSVYVDRENAY